MTSALKDIFQPPVTRAGRIRRIHTRISLGTVVAVLAVGLGWVTIEMIQTCGSLKSKVFGIFESGVYRVGGECVGVTDGSFVFNPAFADVQEKIATENARVRAESPSYVTVALLDLLTPTATSATSVGEVRSELEGAFTAQRRINESVLPTDRKPQIQLLLANQGNTLESWEPVDAQLEEMTKESHPVVAVIGLGVSTEDTRQRTMKLSKQNIPMVSATITADGLDYNNIPGLIRVSPSNQDHVKALRRYVDSRHNLRSAVMVYDANSDSHADIFTETLKDDITQQAQDLIRQRPLLPFTGASIPSDATLVRFDVVTPNICSAGTDAVFYAGRGLDLDSFLQSLENRQCRDKLLTVLTGGDDLSELLEKHEQRLGAANLIVVSAGMTYPEGWARNMEGTPQDYSAFLSVFRGQGFDDKNLDDGKAIMMHDALQTVVTAVRLAALGTPPLTADKVRRMLLNLNGQFQVPGASGTLSFSPSPTGAGNPHGKPVPVLQFPAPPNSTSRQVGPLYITP